MYSFCDTNQIPAQAGRPSEALCFNGVWIDDDIPSFRTLYVSGRESFTAEITEQEYESMDGTRFLRRVIRPRTILIGYLLVASSAPTFMMAYNRLNWLLSKKQARVIFADEPDKYYIGTCRSVGTPDPGRLAVRAEIEIYCSDPFKYAVSTTSVDTDENGQFTFEYGGNYPVRPIFTAVFARAAKSVAFAGEDAVVTAGNDSSPTPVFAAGDEVGINCMNGAITLNDIHRLDLGDITNEYEKMLLVPGSNIITPSFAGDAPAPKCTLRYRAAWL